MNVLQHHSRPYLCLGGNLFLVLARWNERLFLLYSDTALKKTRLEGFDLVTSTQRGYYWASTGQTSLYSVRPTGVIVGINWENTLFKFFQWACQFHGLNITPEVINGMVARATDAEGYSDLTNPLEFFRYDWVEAEANSGLWTQRAKAEGEGELFSLAKPTGWMCGLPKMGTKLQGIQVLHAAPPRRAIEKLLVEPFQTRAKKLRKS